MVQDGATKKHGFGGLKTAKNTGVLRQIAKQLSEHHITKRRKHVFKTNEKKEIERATFTHTHLYRKKYIYIYYIN